MALTKITSNVIANNAVTQSKIDSSVELGGGGIKISNIQVTDSGGTVLDDTAVDIAGGYIKLTGSGFLTGCQVLINNVPATSTTFVSSTVVRAQVPATAAGTYIVYLVNPDGGVGIRVNGVTFSATPSWVTGSSLEGNVDTALSLQLSATGASTFALQSGSTLPTGLTLSSGGLLSGTVTGLTQETVYSFTVIATDAENQDSPRTFSITITVGDQYFNRTVLAINGDVNTFVSDASTNNFAITVAGDTRPSNFSPYNTNWSNYFDGTGDYLNQSTNRFLDGSTWTVEGWVYTSDTTATIAAQYVSSGGQFSSRTILGISSGLIYIFQAGSSVSGTTNISNNQWYHIAYVRNGSTVKAYVNGILEATFSGFINPSLTTTTFFYDGFNSGQELLGYFSNLRVTTTEVYASNFTPPTSPLTAITGTALLTCQSNRLIDNSTNNFTITKNGDVKISAFGPFTETDTTTGSGYFDGSGDYLTLPSDAALNLGTGAFSVEFWVYITSLAENPTFINTNGTLIFYEVTGSNRGLCVFANSAAQLTSSTTALPLNAWNHVVVCRNSSGNLSSFVNGIRLATVASNTSTFDFSGGIINRYFPSSSGHLFGYTSSLRIVKGSTPYDPTQSTLTVPSSALTAVSNTSLLTLQTRQPVNNHSFIDTSSITTPMVKVGSSSQGSFSPFSPAGWSNYFDGSGDYLNIPYNISTIQWWNTNYTIEMWVYNLSNSASGTNSLPLQVAHGNAGTAETDWAFGTNASGNLYFYYWNGSAVTSGVSTSIVPLNSWNHIAMVYNNTTSILKGYINGTEVFSVAKSGTPNFNSGTTLNIGKVQNTDYRGYISNLRIVRGTTVYTTNFTPPISALTAIANTSLLTCQSNCIKDNSTNNFAITRNGDTAVVNFSPFKPTAQYSRTTHGGSVYFDGDGDYLYNNIANNLIHLNNNFTVEAWVYMLPKSLQILFNTTPHSTLAISLNRTGIGDTHVYIGNGGGSWTASPSINSNSASKNLQLNSWNHVALVRNGATITLYHNGEVAGTTTNLPSGFSGGGIYIGTYYSAGTFGEYFKGHMSGFRIVNGTAIYTAAFTPPTTPPSAVPGTAMLLNYNDAAIVDISSRNVMETVGDAKIVTSTRKYGTGSMYFDGTGDYISLLSSDMLTIGTGDFTVEAWINPGSQPGAYGTIVGAAAAGGMVLTLRGAGTSSGIGLNPYGSGDIFNYSYTFTQGTWVHIAVTRSGTSLRIFINGTQLSSTVTNSTNWGAITRIGAIDSGGSQNFLGYIDDLRITKFARYTANFTPPTGTFLDR